MVEPVNHLIERHGRDHLIAINDGAIPELDARRSPALRHHPVHRAAQMHVSAGSRDLPRHALVDFAVASFRIGKGVGQSAVARAADPRHRQQRLSQRQPLDALRGEIRA